MNFPEGKWIRLPLKHWLIDTEKEANLNFPSSLEFSGVYVFYEDHLYSLGKNRCLYIGSSINLRSRILTQIVQNICPFYRRKDLNWKKKERLWPTYNQISIKVRKDKHKFERLTLEARLIYKLNPIYNKYHKRRSTKEEIKQDIKKLTEDLKPILSGKGRRLIHDDKDKDLIQMNKSHCSNTSR